MALGELLRNEIHQKRGGEFELQGILTLRGQAKEMDPIKDIEEE